MKYGALVHKNTQNIGDDIQTYASSRFLPTIDYVIDREKLDEFESKDGKPVAVIMNGWYMWMKWRWPPSKTIIPKFLAVHYTDPESETLDGSPIRFDFIKGLGGDYLRAYGPIGCRDEFTVSLFRDLGIDSYFSGCITLTLPKMPIRKSEREYVCLVDVDIKTEDKAKDLLKEADVEIKIMTNKTDYRGSDASWEERAQAVEDLLTVYQNAKCVVTRRLHCVLPCLAMDVPVLLVKKDLETIRFHPYYNWVYNTSPDKFAAGEYNDFLIQPKPNMQRHMETREKLITAIWEFIEQTKISEESAEQLSKVPYSNEKLIRWQNETMKQAMDQWMYASRADFHKMREMRAELEKQTNRLSEQTNRLREQTNKLNKTEKRLKVTKEKLVQIKMSKTYKIGRAVTMIPRKIRRLKKQMI